MQEVCRNVWRPIKLIAVVVVTGGLMSSSAARAERQQGEAIDFAHQVVPILQKHCATCHAGERAEGDFSINSRQAILDTGVIEPGDADGSYLIELVTSDDPEERMPQKSPALSAQDVATLRAWINAGMPWEEGYTFSKETYEPPLLPRRPELPPPVDGRTNPIDRILDAYLVEHKLSRPEPIDDAVFMRRLYLDVVGLLPDPDRLAAFLADENPDKRQRLIEEVLGDDRAYAEHWLTFWNDLLRNDYEGTGYIDGGRKQISKWLYNSLRENKPYDQFVRELIAPSSESEGFIRGIKWRGNVNASQRREVQFAQNVSQVFLGINMKCASCHDSFIDRWKLKETYGLAAVIAEGPLETHRCDKPTGEMVKAAWIFPELGQLDADAPEPERLEQLARLMTDPRDGRLTRTIANRLWHRFMGYGIVHPVDAMHTRPWNADLLDYLAVYLADEKYDLKALIALIAGSEAYQSQSHSLPDNVSVDSYVYTGACAKRMTAEQFVDAVWQVTGAGPKKPHESVASFVETGSDDNFRPPVRAALVSADLLMRSLGRPNRDQVVTTRPASLTTLQAIDLSNGPILAKALRSGAARIMKHNPGTTDELIDQIYVEALSRHPSEVERQAARELVGEKPTPQAVEDLLWSVLMLPEFQLVR